jgi:hypothetical protein
MQMMIEGVVVERQRWTLKFDASTPHEELGSLAA